MYDVIVLGGGVIGLSITWELIQRGARVLVLNRRWGAGARVASWSAAGIVPAAPSRSAGDPLAELERLSRRLYLEWVQGLERASGVPVEFLPSGGLHLSRSNAEAIALRGAMAEWIAEGIECAWVSGETLQEIEPELVVGAIVGGVFTPTEWQIRPPRVLRALERAIQEGGGEVRHVDESIEPHFDRVGPPQVELRNDILVCDKLVIAAGPWSRDLLARQGLAAALEPRRGQVALFGPSSVRLTRIVNEGPRYLVPRGDGRVLVGSTVEDVGFDMGVRNEDVGRLMGWARELVPGLGDVPLECAWSGLRPATGDGLPLLGGLTAHPRVFVATGHFRAGIQLAPATARVMIEAMGLAAMSIDRTPFRPDRF